eukprot:GDKI01007197.1.p1 GENE.GDKI01007197.1~~GDKI01007197.1.p1  ORF type:complete len:238 (-),score=34.84 GDKI01007197.1:55-768(-)
MPLLTSVASHSGPTGPCVSMFVKKKMKEELVQIAQAPLDIAAEISPFLIPEDDEHSSPPPQKAAHHSPLKQSFFWGHLNKSQRERVKPLARRASVIDNYFGRLWDPRPLRESIGGVREREETHTLAPSCVSILSPHIPLALSRRVSNFALEAACARVCVCVCVSVCVHVCLCVCVFECMRQPGVVVFNSHVCLSTQLIFCVRERACVCVRYAGMYVSYVARGVGHLCVCVCGVCLHE